MENYIDSSILTAFATGLLVIVGIAQVAILNSQKSQTRLELINEYRRCWRDNHKYWGKIVFIGRNPEEYYQIVEESKIAILKNATKQSSLDTPTIWARDSIRTVGGILSEVCVRILQGQLEVSDVYPIFGTELLRHSRPLRKLLEPNYQSFLFNEQPSRKHLAIRSEVQNWLIYHDGIRRRCLILLDLLWAEAVRLEDLPPSDIRDAANAKEKSGKLNRQRLFKETFRLNGFSHLLLAFRLSSYLRHSEYRSFLNRKGISKKRLDSQQSSWNKRLTGKYLDY